MIWKKGAALLLALLMLLCGCAAKEEPAAQAATDAAAPTGILSDFTATDLDGNTVTAQSAFADYRLTMVNVWGTFCSPCIKEMPDLGQLSRELEEKNVRVIGIVTDAMGSDGAIDQNVVSTAKEIASMTGANYLHLLPSEDLMGLLYQIQAVPTTFFVDANGCQVGTAYAGAMDKAQWLEIIEGTLKELD